MEPRLPAYLGEARSPWRAIALAWPTATIPALLLSALVAQVFGEAARPDFSGAGGLGLFALLVLFAPFFETLIMAAVLEVLVRLVPPWLAIIISAVGWGTAHSLAAPAWGLIIWWIFLVLSTLYVTWRKRSYMWAILIPFAVHALNNSIPALALLRSA